MKGRQVVLGRHFGGEAAALMVDGRVEDLALDASALTPLPPGAAPFRKALAPRNTSTALSLTPSSSSTWMSLRG